MKSILLCGGKACCPTLSLLEDKKTVHITDDDNNTVKMDVSQAKLITKALKDLLKEDK
tara:strand:+ start:4293 stop:4466 length:174 start_codon:yes stop_codon:yes gene_type:complete